MPTNIEKAAREIAEALAKHHQALDLPPWKEVEMTLQVTYSAEKQQFELRAGSRYDSGSVKGTNLADVMKEVARRAGYDDKAEAQVQASLTALPHYES